MKIILINGSSTPLYEQIKNAIKENGYKIEDAGAVHLEPIGLYSKRVKDVADLKDGAKVYVSNNKAEWGTCNQIISI